MRDFAISENPRVQAQLDRLGALSLPSGRLGLDTARELCARLGDPQRRLPPVFHVAGTNGKGSTCAYLRAILEAQGLTVHTATKPHLVRYNERIRVAGKLIADDHLADLLERVLDAGADLEPSFFEVTTVATFLAFAETPADVCVIETGLGGRLDATNVLENPAVCGIATLGIDHEAFLLVPEAGTPDEPLARIAFEKASIAKPGAPLVVQSYPASPLASVLSTADKIGTPVLLRGRDWWAEVEESIQYRDAQGTLDLPLPGLVGAHQADNAALAVAMLRHQSAVPVGAEAMAEGIRSARWPARLQRLGPGPLTALAPEVDEIWLDGGHNPDAANAIATFFAGAEEWRKPFVIIGMLANKNARTFIDRIAPTVGAIVGVPIPGHDHHSPAHLAELARAAGVSSVGTSPDFVDALGLVNRRGRQGDGRSPVLIAGSLYLAGEVLRFNHEIPD